MQTQWSPKRSSLNSKGTSKIQLIGKQILKIDDQVTANLYFPDVISTGVFVIPKPSRQKENGNK